MILLNWLPKGLKISDNAVTMLLAQRISSNNMLNQLSARPFSSKHCSKRHKARSRGCHLNKALPISNLETDKTLLFMSPIQRGNVQTKLFQLCSTLKAQLLHDGSLHRFRMPRPDQDHILDLKLFWIFCIYIADMNDTSKTFKNIPKYHQYEGLSSLKPQLSVQLQGVQTWSYSTWKPCEATGELHKHTCSNDSQVRSATKAEKVCNQSLQYPPVCIYSILFNLFLQW